MIIILFNIIKMNNMKKIFCYIILPLLLYSVLTLVLYFIFNNNLDIAINSSLSVTQGFAIIIGGLWAYRKFGWDKKCENIITLKASLMEYSYRHNLSAAQYHKDSDVSGYKLRLLTDYNNLTKKIHLSYYVNSKLRKKIFNAIWLTVGNDAGENYSNLTENWKKFDQQLKEIYKDFDSIISL